MNWNWNDAEQDELWKAWLDSIDMSSVNRVFAIATRAVELVAARGGTMHESDIPGVLRELDTLAGDALGPRIRLHAHITAQGARIAALEEEVDEQSSGRETYRLALERAEATIKTLEHERAERAEAEAKQLKSTGHVAEDERKVAAMLALFGERREKERAEADTALSRLAAAAQRMGQTRKRSLEPANIERLISEKGLPAAMQWVLGDGCLACGAEKANDIPPALCAGCEAEANSPGFPDGSPIYPCSPACTHPDAATPGHPERVRERSARFDDAAHHALVGSVTAHMREAPVAGPYDDAMKYGPEVRGAYERGQSDALHDAVEAGRAVVQEAYNHGAEAMRAACWEAVRRVSETAGAHGLLPILQAAIEGATP